MKKKNNKNIYSGNNLKKINKAYNQELKAFVLNKNIRNNKKEIQFLFFEKLLKLFLKFILLCAITRFTWKNRPKIDELVDRAHAKFSSKENSFIPISQAFYFLVSFAPIITMITLLLSFVPGYDQIFLNVILAKIIPGLNQVFKLEIVTNLKSQYISMIILFLTSLWLSSNGYGKFVYTQSYIYNHEKMGNIITNRLRGFFIVLGITLYLFIVILFYIFIYNTFIKYISNPVSQNVFFYITFCLYLPVVSYFGFLFLFKFSPKFKLSWNQINPGVLISTVPMFLFVSIFGLLTSFINYGKYGLIGTFMYVALFVMFFSYFVWLGIIINESYYKTYFSSYTIDKNNFWSRKIKI
ncbi:YihY/virulence factor BrkB family protein [Mycoplasmopsis gallinarum]|uniref:YihY/virulence factor BrkB family protein n=1 Tax=Mycoplasmopsis gallinarum TaxID=29557 RepID=UPI0004823A70|nr:YihY/virulence factor BrkB family protein [Mycoplasmopsis gallinarum]